MHVPRAGVGSALWAPESLTLATPRTGWSSSETRAQAGARRPSMWPPQPHGSPLAKRLGHSAFEP